MAAYSFPPPLLSASLKKSLMYSASTVAEEMTSRRSLCSGRPFNILDNQYTKTVQALVAHFVTRPVPCRRSYFGQFWPEKRFSPEKISGKWTILANTPISELIGDPFLDPKNVTVTRLSFKTGVTVSREDLNKHTILTNSLK